VKPHLRGVQGFTDPQEVHVCGLCRGTGAHGKAGLHFDGSRFTDLSGFYDEVSRSIIPAATWDRNLDAFK
jgi:hypothetical protein